METGKRPDFLQWWSVNRKWRRETSENEKPHTVRENRLRSQDLSLVL